MEFQTILDAVRSLPVRDQVRLMQEIQDDLQLDSQASEVSPELAAELDRRMLELDQNPNDVVAWEDVLAEARKRHNR